MPISGPASYLPTTDEFIAHWNRADEALAPGPQIILAGGTAVSTLVEYRNALEADRAVVEAARNELEGARSDIEILKAELLDRLNQFNGKLRSVAGGTRWEAMLAKVFTVTEGMGRVLPPLDETADLWERYETYAGPFILRDNYVLDTFTADLATLKTAYSAWSKAEVALGLARGIRNERQAKIHEVLKQYRQRIPVEFAPGSAIVETLPRLTPLPGGTPDAVTLAGTYNPATGNADLTWSEIADGAVTRLEIRASAGPEYDPEDETIVAALSPSGERAWSGTFGLPVPGSAASFRVYTLTARGNERGSNPVTIVRTK